MQQGGLSTVFAERVDRFQRDVHGAIAVYADREATLLPSMAGIESRYLRGILLVDMDGYGDRENVIRLSRVEVVALRAALSAALRATEDDWDEL